MAFFNYVTKEITLKVVYYGPGLSGKTTNLQNLYSALDPAARGKFISLATESDRTLFFDFLPIELGRIKDFSVRFQLYTVPGQIRYNATRKLVLKGADAVVFVADSQTDMKEQNIESFMNMRENLVSNNIDPEAIPVVLQYNKRDLSNILSVAELNGDLNKKDYQVVEAVAVDGRGVEETFRLVTRILLKDLVRKHKVEVSPSTEEKPADVVPESAVSAAVSASSGVSSERTEDVVASGREKIFPETAEEIVSVKIPDSSVFELKEPGMSVRSVGEQRAEGLKKDDTVSFAEKETISAKAPGKPVLEVEDVGTRSDITEPYRTAAPLREKMPPPPPPPYSDAKFDQLLILAAEIRQSLTGIKEGLTQLSSSMKESGKQQADMVKILRDVRDNLSESHKKRRWFRFFSS